MADIKRLEEVIKQSGMTKTAIAEKSGIKRETFHNRLNGIGEFTSSEIVGLSEALRLTKPERDAIFLCKRVE